MDIPDGESAGRMPVSWCSCVYGCPGSARLIPRVVEFVRESYTFRLELDYSLNKGVGKGGGRGGAGLNPDQF